MSTNVYELACLHATSEISEIDAQIEKLTQRKELIGKLLDLFEQLAPQSASTEVLAPEVAAAEHPE